MAYKTLIFGIDDMFDKLKSFYGAQVQRGNLDIFGYAIIEGNGIRLVVPEDKGQEGQIPKFNLAIISSQNDFYRRMKLLEAQGFPRNRIIDGRIFKVPGLDFSRLLSEGVAYGVLKKNSFAAKSHAIYPQVYKFEKSTSTLTLGAKSYLTANNIIYGNGEVIIGKFCPVARNVAFAMGENFTHNYRNVHTFGILVADWEVPKDFYPTQGTCKILIGNDVWIGRGCIFKSTHPERPLVIGDGAVVASDSVVVKNIPPYAIVGGNPAKIIKYRFPPHVIESLLRIKWWDWSLDKIHDNFKYFNDIEKFISIHDK